MRQNVFLLSSVCVYFLMQTTNLVAGIPLDTDTSVLVTLPIDGSQKMTRDEIYTLEKRVGAIRNDLGKAACDYKTSHAATSSVYKLYSAGCDNDKFFTVDCHEYTPHTGKSSIVYNTCNPDEICKSKVFTNDWGVQKTEVYCQKVEPKKLQWAGPTVSKTNCSPGVTGNDAKGTAMGFVAEFYLDASRTKRANVAHSWIQSNKRGRLADKSAQNGVYVQATLAKGETVQACFVRSSGYDATYAYLKFAEEDL